MLCALLPVFRLAAQPEDRQRFAAAGYAGINLAQIDGDYYFGYHQKGIRFGIETQLLLSPKLFLSAGLGFNQMGSQATRRERNERGGKALGIRLNTVEIPLLLHYRLGNRDATGKKQNYQLFRSGILQIGLAFNRITGYQISRQGGTENLPRQENWAAVEEQFEQLDVFGLVGINIPIGLRNAILIQHGRSFRGLYRPESEALREVLPLFPYYLTLGIKHTLY